MCSNNCSFIADVFPVKVYKHTPEFPKASKLGFFKEYTVLVIV